MKHLILPTAPFSFVADGLAIGGIVAYGEPLPFAFALNVAQEAADSGDPYVMDGISERAA